MRFNSIFFKHSLRLIPINNEQMKSTNYLNNIIKIRFYYEIKHILKSNPNRPSVGPTPVACFSTLWLLESTMGVHLLEISRKLSIIEVRKTSI